MKQMRPVSIGHGETGLHVAHVVLALDVGGLERNVINQVREGRKLGQRVSILCLDQPGELAGKAREYGATVIALGRKQGLHPGMILQAKRVLADWRPDVVHTHQLVTLLYAGIAAKWLRVPAVIHTEHGREKYTSRLRTRLLGRIAGRCCDRFFCLTAEMAGRVQGARIVPERKLGLIENGIDLDAFSAELYDGPRLRMELGIPPAAPVIGTVGRLTEIKRQDVLIRAFAQVQKRFELARLLLVGDGPRRPELEALVREMHLEGSVHFVGYQPHSGPYLKAMDVFALTSRSEGMPQAVLEAAAMGLPVIGSRVGGIPEVVEEGRTGLLFEVGNHTELAECICDLLCDREKARAFGAAGQKNVHARFSVARMAADYHRAVLALLGREATAIPVVPAPTAATPARLALEEVR